MSLFKSARERVLGMSPFVDYDRLARKVKRHLGYSGLAFQSPAGFLTIGYGRNLDAKGISKLEAENLLTNDLHSLERELSDRLTFFLELDGARKEVLINVAISLGVQRLMGYHALLLAMEGKSYELAANELLNSEWGRKSGDRALELAETLRHGEWPEVTG